jgi:hypothetical protein
MRKRRAVGGAWCPLAEGASGLRILSLESEARSAAGGVAEEATGVTRGWRAGGVAM